MQIAVFYIIKVRMMNICSFDELVVIIKKYEVVSMLENVKRPVCQKESGRQGAGDCCVGLCYWIGCEQPEYQYPSGFLLCQFQPSRHMSSILRVVFQLSRVSANSGLAQAEAMSPSLLA